MTSCWFETQIGDQFLLQRGFDITKAEQHDGSIPVISSGGVSSHHTVAMCRGPGVIIGRKGTLGSVYFESSDYWPHDTTLWVKDFKGNLPRFVYYFLKYMSDDLLALDSGSSNPTLNRNHLHPMKVLWPKYAIQSEIVEILSSFDDKIELNRRMNRTLEEMAQALFKSWFVDFDPVVAKSEGRKPYGMSDEIAALFPDSFEESELGPIPKGWRVGRANDEFYITMGQSPPGQSYNDVGEGLPFYQGRTDFGVRYPTRRIYTTDPKRIAHAGETLVTVRAPVGDVNMILEECCIGRGLSAVKHRNGCDSFCFHTMRSLRSEFDVFDADGTLFGSISSDGFRSIKIVIADSMVVDTFNGIAKHLDEKVRVAWQETKALESMRDSLLPVLLSGEISLAS